jgi:hypothetical protein
MESTNQQDDASLDGPSESESDEPTAKRHLIHPAQLSFFKPKLKVPNPKNRNSKSYGFLDDNSSYAKYAWEFLRRNRFYQALIDGVHPSFSIDDWGYRATASHEAHFGLRQKKAYSQEYEEIPPHWWPIAEVEDRMRPIHPNTRLNTVSLEYPRDQIAVVFDLSPGFGPNTVALRTQADLIVAHLQCLVIQRAKLRGHKIDKVPEQVNKPSKQLLRTYLMTADLLSNPQYLRTNDNEELPIAMRRFRAPSISPDDAFKILAKSGISGAEANSLPKGNPVYRFAEKAKAHIYGWHCLTLLKFDTWQISCQQSDQTGTEERP